MPREQLVEIVRETDRATDSEVNLPEGTPGLLRAPPDVLEEYIRMLRHERGAKPAVRDLARQLERVRAEGRQVDRDVGLRLGARADRFTLAARKR